MPVLGRYAAACCAPLAILEARARTRTHTFLRSETRSAVDRLREQLAPDDRALLILRLDRGLSWNEIAAIMADENSSSADDFRRDAAAWRKRFERVKDRLRKMAESAGLLRDDE
jgi:RNA polymerase sigma-70 factor (ECF subfamily)